MSNLCKNLKEIVEEEKTSTTAVIAKYFLDEDIDNVKKNGIEEIAKRCYTTKSTISRFVKNFEIDDFKTFKHIIIDERKKILDIENKIHVEESLINSKNYAKVFDDSIIDLKKEIDLVFQNKEILMLLADSINLSKRIVIFSDDSLYSDIADITNKIQWKGKNLIHMQNRLLSFAYTFIESREANDVVLFMSDESTNIEAYKKILRQISDLENVFIMCPSIQEKDYEECKSKRIVYLSNQWDKSYSLNHILVKIIIYLITRLVL